MLTPRLPSATDKVPTGLSAIRRIAERGLCIEGEPAQIDVVLVPEASDCPGEIAGRRG